MKGVSKFNIESKNIIRNKKISYDNILSICILSDGRIATSTFGEVVIYNIEKDKIDMIINENIEEVSYLFEMKNSYLFSSACEECIIYKIKENEYEIIQKLGELFGDTRKALELNNGDIIVLSKGFYIFKKDPAENKYLLNKNLEKDKWLTDIIEIDTQRVLISNQADGVLTIWNTKNWSVVSRINDIAIASYNNCLYKPDHKHLIIGGQGYMYLIDINTLKIKQKIDKIYEIYAICKINKKEFLTLGNNGTITQWRFDNSEIQKEHEKEKINSNCLCMKYLNNGKILLSDAKNLIILK